MKNYKKALLIMPLALLCLAGCGNTDSGSTSSSQAEDEKISINDNAYKDKTSSELLATSWQDWVKKGSTVGIEYFFEGQYTEGFGNIVDPMYLDIYCVKDGSLYAKSTGDQNSVASMTARFFGYWYNVDAKGEATFELYLTVVKYDTGLKDVNPDPSVVDLGRTVDIYPENHGIYSWSGGVTYPVGMFFGTKIFTMDRTCVIYGQKYKAAKSLSIVTSGGKTAYHVGEAFDSTGLAPTVTRAEGKAEDLYDERPEYTGFDSSKVGTETIIASFLGASTTFNITVSEATK